MTDDDLREQLKISKEFLEHQHGAAIRHGNVQKARHYFNAISLVEDALDHAWRTGEPCEERWDGMGLEFVEESRQARDRGRKEATLHEKHMTEMREKYETQSPIDRLLEWWYS